MNSTLYILLFFWFSQLHTALRNFTNIDPTANIAFIFAGGLRTFSLPVIHESIKYNLIHSFCPPLSCTGDIFVRLSLDDNTHDGQGFNSKGKVIKRNDENVADVLSNIQRIAHDSPQGKLIHEVVNIGSAEEAKQMDDVTSKDLKQKIYRDLDPRRYSMHFNRWKAYEMMLKEERDSNKKYLWVAHVRLDMAWGAPIKPFSTWSLTKIWVPDTWYADVPDTFALVPRQLSDIYFLLEKQYGPDEVMCLGGPNFDVHLIEFDSLKQRGYSETEIKLAMSENCFGKYNQDLYTVTHEANVNITWTNAGESEEFLKRKLKFYGISLDTRQLGFSAFFTFIVRSPMTFVCFYTEPKYFIPWIKASQHASNAIGTGCSLMRKHINSLGLTSCDLQTYQMAHKSSSPCLIDKKVTDWNFLPFRIRRKGDVCISAELHPAWPSKSPDLRALTMGSCQATTLVRDYITDYTTNQLFSVHPLSQLPQRVTSWDYDVGLTCLSVSADYVIEEDGVSGGPVSQKRLLEMKTCATGETHLSQLFRVYTLIGSGPGSVSGPLQKAPTPQAQGLGTSGGGGGRYDQLLPDKVIAIVKWEGEGRKYCVFYEDAESNATSAGRVITRRVKYVGKDRRMQAQAAAVPLALNQSYAVLDFCNKGIGRKISKSATFVFERSQIKSSTW